MHEERQKILDMLSEGKITAEEAERLLKALPKRPPAQAGRWPGLDWLASLFGLGAQCSEEQDWTLDGADVSSIKAETDNGAISLRGSDQDQVAVRAWKKVRAPSEAAAKEFAQQVQIHVERQGNEVHVYKEHPRPPLGYSVSVRYEISCPRAVDVNLRTSNGAIKIHTVDGKVEAVTSNGAIELQGGTGKVHLHTSNGIERPPLAGRDNPRYPVWSNCRDVARCFSPPGSAQCSLFHSPRSTTRGTWRGAPRTTA